MSKPSGREKTIFLEAVEFSPGAERVDYLDRACGQDRELRAMVEALLSAHECRQPLLDVTQDQPPEPLGTQIGPYKLLQVIGEGGMGVVYMADQAEPVQRRVALKIIKPGMDSRQVIARFEAERQALSMMDHPNIATVLDAGTTESGRPYFVMELVKGQPITQYCDEKHLTPRQRLELLLPVCQAIQHAHQKGIIHRDIKPTNILVAEYDQQPVPKVIDFGVAKATSQALTEKTMFTGLGQIVGTLEYMSPEQAKVNQLDIDTRSDIYSLGVLLYELLTGSTPFDKQRLRSAAFDEVLRIIREEEPPKPSTRLSDLSSPPMWSAHSVSGTFASRNEPPASSLASIAALRHTEPAKLAKLVRGELDWIVMKALEKDRNRRYETASALASDLQRYLQDEPVVACPPSTGYRLRKFVRRNKGPVLAAISLLAMLIAMLGLALVSNYHVNNALTGRNEAFTKLKDEQKKTAGALRRETDALTRQTEALAAKTKALTDLGTAKQETETANESLKETIQREQQAAYQHRIALAHREWLAGNPVRSMQLLEECHVKYRHWEWNFLYRLHHTNLLTVRAGYYVDDVAYSPDGRLLASVGDVARVWEARTGRLLFPLSGHTGQVHRVVFSPDGTRLATSGFDGTLRVWDAATGKQLVSIDRPTGYFSMGLSFSPDGLQIACDEGGPNSAAAKFWDAATGKELFSWQAPELPPGRARSRLVGVTLSPDGKYLAAFSLSSIWLVEVQTKKAVPLNVSSYNIFRVVFSRDGSRMAAASANGQVRTWQVPTGDVLSTMQFSAERFWGLAFSPDGRWLAAAGSEHSVQVVNSADGREILSLRGHADVVNAAVFSPSGRQIASAGRDGTIRFWDITAPQEGPRFSGPSGGIRRAIFSDDSQRLTAITPHLMTWELSTGRSLFARPFDFMSAGINAPALSRDGRYVAGNNGGNLFLFEATTGKELFAQRSDKLVTSSLAFSPDGRLLAEGSRDGWVRVRDGQTGRLLQSLQGHRYAGANSRVAFSPDGSRLASGSREPNVKIWNTANWQELHSLDGHSAAAALLCLTYSHDNRYLASGASDKKICIWDATTGSKLFDLAGQADSVLCVTFSPDGKRLFSCGTEGSINVWDVENRVKLLTLHHRGQFVSISPDGHRLASWSADSPAVQVWDSELLSREERWKRHLTRIPFWQPQSAAAPAPKPQPKTNDEILQNKDEISQNKTGR